MFPYRRDGGNTQQENERKKEVKKTHRAKIHKRDCKNEMSVQERKKERKKAIMPEL